MPELVYNVKFRIDTTDIGSGSAPISAYKEQAEQLKAELAEAEALIQRMGKGSDGVSKNFTKSQKETAKATEASNKQIAIGNQLFFSLSDGVQDATQFSYGFATGMRAVGNNIGFTAELAGNFIQRTKEMNNGVFSMSNAMKGLSQTLGGVGGVIFLINSLVTIVTAYTASQEKANKEAENSAKKNRVLNKIFEDQEQRLRNIAQLTDTDTAALETSFIEGYRRNGQEILVIQDRISKITSDIDTDQGKINTLLEEGRYRYYEVGNEITRQVDQLQKKIEFSERDKVAAETELAILLDQQKALNEQERIARETYEARSEAYNQNLTQLLRLHEEQVTEERIAERYLELQESITNTIRERGREVREQRAEDIRLQQQIMSMILNPPKPDEDPSDKAEERTMQRIKKELEATRQLELFRAKSNIKSIEDFDAYYDKELNALKYQLNAKLITQAEYNLRSEQLNKEHSDARMQIEETAASMIMGINSNLASSITGLLSSAFQNNKAIAIAETIVSTYFAAQQAYAATLAGAALNPLTSPIAPALAKKAAISAVLQGAARVAAIAATEIGSKSVATSGGGGGSSAGAFGFQMNKIEGPQTFRTPAFAPTNGDRRSTPKVDVRIMADRKQLYAIVKQGEEEYRQIKV